MSRGGQGAEDINFEYGETLSFSVWIAIIFTIAFLIFVSYFFLHTSFDTEEPEQETEANDEEEENREEGEEQEANISLKLKKKREKKKAERAYKEALKKEKDEKLKKLQEKQDEYDRKYIEREEKLAREAKEKEEESNRIFEEYKAQFVVEEGGFVEEEKTLTDVVDFIHYIKLKKRVNIEDLAAFTGMKTNLCVDRIDQLEGDNRIFGFYLYITEDEIEQFCAFIKQMGRIHKQSDLVSACNRIFRLEPLDKDKEEIERINSKTMPKDEEIKL